MENGRPVPTDETFERRGPYVISSIGSIPEPIEGIDMKGELFAFSDWELGRLDAYPTVFSAGNIVTGKGNIVASRKHARSVAREMAEAYLGLGESAREEAHAIAAKIAKLPASGADQVAALRERVTARQREVGYDGDYAAWIERVTPPDLA
jgi:hypothetical protein